MQAPIHAPAPSTAGDPREIYSELNQNHLCLKSWEAIRGEKAEGEFVKKYHENLQALFERQDTVERLAKEMFNLLRSDPAGVEGVHRQLERKFLGSIKKAVFYLTKTGNPIDWEANSERMVAALKRQLELCNHLKRVYPPEVLKMQEQDIEEHQDQFSVTFYSCAKRSVEDYKDTIMKALSGNAEGPVVLMETPLLHHSIDCVGNYDLLRRELEKAQGNEAERTVDNPAISSKIKAFAQSFKKVKEIGMMISLKNCEFNIQINQEILSQLGPQM